MAIVKDQNLPLENIEDGLNPPIPFIDTYRRVLGEGIDHPGLPAGEETVDFSKKESRPAERSLATPGPSAASEAWRQKFRECLACWEAQVDQEADEDDCKSARNRHYVKPWVYVPGAKNTFFNSFMRDCLLWVSSHPGVKYWKCEDLTPTPNPFDYCPGDPVEFQIENANGPSITEVDCGTVGSGLSIIVNPDPETCPESCEVKFTDNDGRRGCAQGYKREDCVECSCEGAELQIVYTTLVMAFLEHQTLSIDPAKQGCPPYVWSLVGPGTLVPSEDGLTALYTAPSSNPGCADAVIHLSDGCSLDSEISIRVSYAGDYYLYTWVYAYGYTCLGQSVKHYYVYGKQISCMTGEVYDEWFETEFSVIGAKPTSPSQSFCCEEGDGDVCAGGCGMTFQTDYCDGCTMMWGQDCCPP